MTCTSTLLSIVYLIFLELEDTFDQNLSQKKKSARLIHFMIQMIEFEHDLFKQNLPWGGGGEGRQVVDLEKLFEFKVNISIRCHITKL